MQDAVRAVVLQVAAQAVGAIGRLLGELGGLVLALLAQGLAHAAHVGGEAADPLTGVGRALLDLRAQLGAGPLLCLAGGLLGLVLRLVGRGRVGRLVSRVRVHRVLLS